MRGGGKPLHPLDIYAAQPDGPLRSQHLLPLARRVSRMVYQHSGSTKMWAGLDQDHAPAKQFTDSGSAGDLCLIDSHLPTTTEWELPWFVQAQHNAISAWAAFAVDRTVPVQFRIRLVSLVDAASTQNSDWSQPSIVNTKHLVNAIGWQKGNVGQFVLPPRRAVLKNPTLPSSRRVALRLNVQIDDAQPTPLSADNPATVRLLWVRFADVHYEDLE